jgi:tetratricopeptide (TPR) repeat protein
VALLAWLPAAPAPYQYDDHVTPLRDPASQSLSAWSRSIPATLRPLTKLTFAVESSAGATSAPARRVLHAAVFAGCAVLLAAIAAASGLGAAPVAMLAALWAAHPVHAESVVALAGRSSLLALFLSLLGFAALLRRRGGLAVAMAALAVLARETAWPWLVATACVAAWDRWHSRARVALALGAATVTGGAIALSSSRLRELLLHSWHDGAIWDRLGLQWAAVSRGTAMLLLDPAGFSVDVDFAPRGLARLALLGATVALYAAAAWIALRPRHPRAVRLAALLWLCLVVPLHSVVPKLDPLTARSFSASSAALVLLVAAALPALRERLRLPPAALWASAGLALLALGATASWRAGLYRDPIALWRDAAERSTGSTRPFVNLGTLLAHAGRLDEARAALEEAVRRDGSDGEARQRLAAIDVLAETGELLERERHHEKTDSK